MLKFQQRDRLKFFANPCVPVSGEGINVPSPLFRVRQVDSLSAVQPHGTNPVPPGLRVLPQQLPLRSLPLCVSGRRRERGAGEGRGVRSAEENIASFGVVSVGFCCCCLGVGPLEEIQQEC